MNVVHPGSLALDVSSIVDHSFAELLTALSVGATFVRIHVANFVASFHALSFTLTRNDNDVGSFCVSNK